jgi:hypothetical protein
MSDPSIRVLFVSTSNASHSIFAEALLRRVGDLSLGERVRQFVLVTGRTSSAVAS